MGIQGLCVGVVVGLTAPDHPSVWALIVINPVFTAMYYVVKTIERKGN